MQCSELCIELYLLEIRNLGLNRVVCIPDIRRFASAFLDLKLAAPGSQQSSLPSSSSPLFPFPRSLIHHFKNGSFIKGQEDSDGFSKGTQGKSEVMFARSSQCVAQFDFWTAVLLWFHYGNPQALFDDGQDYFDRQ